MSRKRTNPFESKIMQTKEPLEFYVIACEGAHTERRYFEGLYKEKEELNLKVNLKVEILKREDKGMSHPIHVITQLDKYKEKFGLEDNELCLVIDRDKGSFFDDQFDDILEQCKEKKYRCFISNPCFEFWLILHLIDAKFTDEEKQLLLENEKENGLNYIDAKLSELLGKKYNKKIYFDHYKEGIQKALKNSLDYENDIKKLKFSLGTNVSSLIEQMFA